VWAATKRCPSRSGSTASRARRHDPRCTVDRGNQSRHGKSDAASQESDRTGNAYAALHQREASLCKPHFQVGEFELLSSLLVFHTYYLRVSEKK
jgi:hypothetical protein